MNKDIVYTGKEGPKRTIWRRIRAWFFDLVHRRKINDFAEYPNFTIQVQKDSGYGIDEYNWYFPKTKEGIQEAIAEIEGAVASNAECMKWVMSDFDNNKYSYIMNRGSINWLFVYIVPMLEAILVSMK